jgi:hypothetical protein
MRFTARPFGSSTLFRAVAADFSFNCWCLEIPSDNRIRHVPRCIHYQRGAAVCFNSRGFCCTQYAEWLVLCSYSLCNSEALYKHKPQFLSHWNENEMSMIPSRGRLMLTLLMLQCAERFQRAERMDFSVDSFFPSIAACINPDTAPTSRRVCLLPPSARHDRFLKTLAVTCSITSSF